MFKVEKGIKRRRLKYPLKEMNVGDSFLIPSEILTPVSSQNVYSVAKQQGIKVHVELWDEGLRVWRIK